MRSQVLIAVAALALSLAGGIGGVVFGQDRSVAPAGAAGSAASAASASSQPAFIPSQADLDRRREQYKPYDGYGSYTMVKDDGVRGIQGLFAQAERFGVKPYAQVLIGADAKHNGQGGQWQTERVCFKDLETSATMIRLTNDRYADRLSYFQGNWNADGSKIVWFRSPELNYPTHGGMMMNPDGTEIHNAFRDSRWLRKLVCSPMDPALCFMEDLGDKMQVVAYDPNTGQRKYIVSDKPCGWYIKVSMDGKYLIGRGKLSTGLRGFTVYSVDGKEYYEVPADKDVHDSYRIHPTLKKVMFWVEGDYRTEGFRQCNFDGSDMQATGVKFDWNHGDFGLDRGISESGAITMIQGEKWSAMTPLFAKPGVEYYDNPAEYNSYVSWWPKDRLWAYMTRMPHVPYVGEITDTSTRQAEDFVANRYRVCFSCMVYGPGYMLDNPNASPDGTKVLFNSNMFGTFNIFEVVARLPESPLDLTAQRTEEGNKLAWKPGKHHAETAGYYVYRSIASGVGFEPLTSKPITATEYVDTAVGKGDSRFYAVTAVEHSGLESPLCDEVIVSRADVKPRQRLFLEPEAGQLSSQMWIAFDGAASNLHYIWMRKKEGTGKATLATPANSPAACTVWARVKGQGGAEFSVACGKSAVTVKAAAAKDWTWVKADGTLRPPEAPQIQISSSLYGSAIDELVLTDDEQFSPATAQRIIHPAVPAVKQAVAEAISPFAVKLSWPAEGIHHYNVYAGKASDFTPGQANIVASPDKPSYVDWGLKPGQILYYRVTCVDRFGQESPAASPVKVTLPTITPVTIEKEYADSIEFQTPVDGTYILWLQVDKTKGKTSGGYNVAMDGKSVTYEELMFDLQADVQWLSPIRPGFYSIYDLKAGKHTLAITNKKGIGFTKVLITNDQSLRPSGHVTVMAQ